MWAAADALGLGGQVVLAPAYHHGSEIEALVRAGAKVRFYAGAADGGPNETELEALASEGARALLLVHVLGFPQDAPRWRRWCDERGLLLIEDCAQAWLASIDGTPVGSWGDLALYCLYKTVGVPDGAALIAPGNRLAGAPGFGAGSRVGPILARGSLAERARARLGGGRATDPQEEFDLGDPTAPAASATDRMLPRLVEGSIPARRRAHYAYLLARLGEWVAPPFDRITPGAAPLAFPLQTENRDGLLAALAPKGIEPLPFWSHRHPLLPAKDFPTVMRRRRTVAAVPVHQDLSLRDLERIVRVCEGWFRRGER
jgi:dTDP-4-amino-4,6-dideoxygalactose transaminase